MSKISRVRFRNVYGITEQEIEPGDITLLRGPNESGKTSFLDSISTALSNKGARTRIVKRNEKEAEMIIDLDDGLTIDRKKRLESSDYLKVSRGKEIINSPESFLRNLFSTEQFNPVRDFCEKTPREQKKVILSLCSINYGREDFIRDFGELPQNYDEGRHVLENLEAIQSINGYYYQTREDTNRNRRQLEAIRDDVLGTLPKGYDADKWREVVLSELFKKVTDGKTLNDSIERATERVNSAADIDLAINNQYDLQVKEAEEFKSFRLSNARKHMEEEETEIRNTIEAHNSKIAELEDMIRKIRASIAGEQSKLSNLSVNLKAVQDGIENEANEKVMGINEARRLRLETASEKVKNAMEFLAENKPINLEPLQEEANTAETMKNFLRESDRISGYNSEIRLLKDESDALTRKIELSRELPTILLKQADMPVPGISIEDGELRVDGLPVDNLSDGRKMEISLEIAKAKAGDLKVVLVDKFESLDPKRQITFISKAKETGLQFFITQVTGGDDIEILEL
jgi:exonuclease SbcC